MDVPSSKQSTMIQKTISVALSGSGFKFPAHVGALLAIEELGYKIVELAGTSGGSIVAALYASGMTAGALKDLTLSRDWSDMMSFSIWTLISSLGVCSGSNLQSYLLSQTQNKTFKDLSIPLTIIASDITHGRPFLMSQDTTPGLPIGLAARASSSIPAVYPPVKINSCSLIDGGVVNNIPVDRLSADSDVKLGVQLVSTPDDNAKPVDGFLDLAQRTLDLLLSASENTHISQAVMRGSKMAFVETGYASSLERNMSQDKREKLLADGYNAVKSVLAG